MKTSDIGSILNAFFHNQNYRAILIDGKWGIGKTYQFKKYFDSLKKKDKKRVFYFTIFGTENMDELNTKIYRKLHPKWSKFLIGYKTISQSVDAVVGLKNSSLNISPNLDYVLDLVKPEKVRKNPILIFDDIERFSNEYFPLFLGLLYKLNLQGARIICLTSSEKLNEKKLIFDDFKEKIFDAVYKIDEPSDDIFVSVFSEIKDIDQQRFILEKCNNNVRILRKASLLYDQIVKEIGEKEKWIVEPSTVIVACCYAIQIVLTKIPGDVKKDPSSYPYFAASEEFDGNIALNYLNALKIIQSTNSSFDNTLSSLILCILRIYLFNNFESIKSLILRQEEPKKTFLDQSFFYLSDENKEKYVKSFSELIANPKIEYEKRYLEIFASIIRFYPAVDDSLIENMVNKYFSYCEDKELDGPSEIEFYLLSSKEDIFDENAKFKINHVVSTVKKKLLELQTNAHTSKLIDAITNKNIFVIEKYIERFTYFSKWLDIKKISDFLTTNGFFLPNLSNDISESEWHFSHVIASLVHLLGLDDLFVKFSESLVSNNASRSLKERLEALIYYKLGRTDILIKKSQSQS